MTPSLRLLLEDFLGLMREEGELDVFLPLLLSAMGHEIVYRAQKGTRQYGVDISSVGCDNEDGQKKLFLWLVKCGDLGRGDWNTGEQSIRQSMEDVGDTYLVTHVAPQHRRLRKKLVVLTNGDFNAALSLTVSAYFRTWKARTRVEAAMVNGSTLAAWTERYLLDEHVLPSSSRTLLRRMLANVGSPELSISVGMTLISGLLEAAQQPVKSPAARRKLQLGGLRGIRTSLSVLHVWAQNERNELAPYRLAEFAVLCVWATMHDEMIAGNRAVTEEFAALLVQWTLIAEAYHGRLHPYYFTQNSLSTTLPDSLIVTDAAFKEVGRLALLGTYWAFISAVGGNPAVNAPSILYADRLAALLETHPCTQSPAYDHHSTDIHVAMLLLVIGNRRAEAIEWLRQITQRLGHTKKVLKHWPLGATFEEALLVRHGEGEVVKEFLATSTLLPVMLLWAAVLGEADVYTFIREKIIPAVPGMTLNFWSADIGYDNLVGSRSALDEHGVGEAVTFVPEEPEQFIERMQAALPEVSSIEQSPWYQFGAPYIPLMAALHWRLQVPREMLFKHAVAVVRHRAA